MITVEQQNRLNELKEAYEKLQSITLNMDPITKIVEEALQEKNLYKLRRGIERAEAVAEAMVHFDYLESKINELFRKYDVRVVDKTDNMLRVYMRLDGYDDRNFMIKAFYDNGRHAPFSELALDNLRQQKEKIDYNIILTRLAELIADKIKPTV